MDFEIFFGAFKPLLGKMRSFFGVDGGGLRIED